MFCRNCGAQLNDNEVICPQCGTQVLASTHGGGEVKNRRRSKPFIIALGVIALICFAAVISIRFTSGSSGYKDALDEFVLALQDDDTDTLVGLESAVDKKMKSWILDYSNASPILSELEISPRAWNEEKAFVIKPWYEEVYENLYFQSKLNEYVDEYEVLLGDSLARASDIMAQDVGKISNISYRIVDERKINKRNFYEEIAKKYVDELVREYTGLQDLQDDEYYLMMASWDEDYYHIYDDIINDASLRKDALHGISKVVAINLIIDAEGSTGKSSYDTYIYMTKEKNGWKMLSFDSDSLGLDLWAAND